MNPDAPWCSTLSPIAPHELDKRLRAGMEEILRKVVARAAAEGGRNFLLTVYLAGMHHGQQAAHGIKEAA